MRSGGLQKKWWTPMRSGGIQREVVDSNEKWWTPMRSFDRRLCWGGGFDERATNFWYIVGHKTHGGCGRTYF